ncbi:putative zinc-binding metallopeptidase [Mycolicibacterium sp.]|uniref:zinc-binding metallopeptidase family protein n=1 Tax=Mycolicibacterium sp. TaxID=2320850 RepID=UPI0028A8963A|nr:putative zinc-binding metallopeptidase [Mycolicibacterium sp.]
MRDFLCPTCGQHLAFENSVCLSCGSDVGFSPEDMAFLVISPDGGAGHRGAVNAEEYQLCANLHLAACNWLVPVAPVRKLCASCSLTRTRPRDDDAAALSAFAEAEQAKRRLLTELCELHLPVVGRDVDPSHGLAFDLLSSAHQKVSTGHSDGVITLDLAEGDDVHRERLRVEMAEPYRTLLGHFRHEIGHYYFFRLVDGSHERLAEFRGLFGDPDADYQAAVQRHYREGAPAGWEQHHVSSYATMHPAEDWAETFAHYLHMRGTLDTAAAYGLAPATATYQRRILGPSGFDTIIEMWLPLVWSLNMVNRAMGKPDLYPFVLAVPVLEKMRFIHTMVDEGSRPG